VGVGEGERDQMGEGREIEEEGGGQILEKKTPKIIIFGAKTKASTCFLNLEIIYY
jgi:hypothetical protein